LVQDNKLPRLATRTLPEFALSAVAQVVVGRYSLPYGQ
jgi:hypothetical protein